MNDLQGYLQQSVEALPFLTRNDLQMHVVETNSSNADRSVEDTVKCMREIIRTSAFNPYVLSRARSLYGESMGGFIVPKLQSIFSYIRSHVKFVEDESVVSMGRHGRELLIRPEVLLTMSNPQGDCDDFTMLGASLMIAMGIRPKIVTIAPESNAPKDFRHVYLRVYYWCDELNKECCIDFDSSHGLYLGWKAPKYYRIQEWTI